MKNTKIVAISDIHNHFPKEMPKADILTISGDLCFAYRHDVFEQKHHVENFIRWSQYLLENKIYDDIVFIPGNHDGVFEYMMLKNEEEKFRKGLPAHIHYLRDSMVNINGIKIYGIPWVLPFCDWFFEASEGQLDKKCSEIPENVDIILSHAPAYGLNDNSNKLNPAKLGSQALLKHLKRVKPSYLCVGHVHNGKHIPIELIHKNQSIKSVNVSILNDDYEIHYSPFEFTL